MPATILFGESKLAGALQELLTVDDEPLLTVDDTPIETVYPDLVLEALTDVNGDPILDVQGSPIIAIVSAAAPPLYWQVADVPSDGGVPFDFKDESNPFQPAAQGGENVFAWAIMTFSWSMAATIQVSAKVDGSGDDVELDNGDVIEFVPSVFALPQQAGTLQRKSMTVAIPLVRRLMRADVEVSRWYLRGQRLQIVVESTGPLGVGELMIDGCEVHTAPVRKAIYPGDVQS